MGVIGMKLQGIPCDANNAEGLNIEPADESPFTMPPEAVGHRWDEDHEYDY
jgi:hypothetical protein